ncbi:hypothetical protein N7G274_010651 [Stereocaulon virgatum]|uniref:Uncharacterized protein n=1 Tax=Stereocaulon virgatum TaxID=373712 RepID=A0ABR3ZU77_9LECA
MTPSISTMSSYRSGGLQYTAVLILLIWNLLVSSCRGYVKWIYPNSDNSRSTFNYIDTVYFTWVSSIPDPSLSLWCGQSSSPNAVTRVYHVGETSTNGTNATSLLYPEYWNNGVCHMELENLSGSDGANSPFFTITLDNAFPPYTWGLSATSFVDGVSNPTAVALPLSTTVSSTAVARESPSRSSTSSLSSPASSVASAASFQTSLSSSKTSPAMTPTPTATEISAPQAPTSPLSEGLDTAAKAGISIGSAFCALAFITTVLLSRNAWMRRTRGGRQGHSSLRLSRPQILEEIAVIGEGAYNEVNGVTRPPELYGMPRAELE